MYTSMPINKLGKIFKRLKTVRDRFGNELRFRHWKIMVGRTHVGNIILVKANSKGLRFQWAIQIFAKYGNIEYKQRFAEKDSDGARFFAENKFCAILQNYTGVYDDKQARIIAFHKGGLK